jgi:hypothetical protein
MMVLSPSRTGLLAQTPWRSPGSRAHCFLACVKSSTTPSPATTRDLRGHRCCLPTVRKGSALGCIFSELNRPARQYLCLRFAMPPHGNHRQDSRPEWSRFSFPVGLFHPLQCAGLSRRSLTTNPNKRCNALVRDSMHPTEKCQHCQKDYVKNRRHRRFCSRHCRWLAWEALHPRARAN